ncbi:MAG: hypothetical protein Q8Q44_09500, partial [Nocardioides sp.]|nr:hypothetical protein [Nocardioides sp.]
VALIPDVLTARFLLFLPGAILVELVALAIDPRRRPVRFGVVSGLLVGTLGLAADWVWTGIFMPLPQPLPASTLPVMLTVGTLAAVGGGLLAVWHVAHLHAVAGDATFPEGVTEPPTSMWGRQGAGLAGVGAFVVLMAAFAPPADGPAMEATVTFSDIERADGSSAPCAGGPEECLSQVTVQVTPADALDDAAWFYGLAWQGRGPSGETDVPQDPESGAPGVVRVALESTGTPGEFRSVEPLPLYGNWKTLLRAHLLPRSMVAAPLHAPDDPAITSDRGREILVEDGETVAFASEKQFLQREIKDEVPTWLNAAAYSAVVGSWLLLIWFYGWCHASAAAAARRRNESVTVP